MLEKKPILWDNLYTGKQIMELLPDLPFAFVLQRAEEVDGYKFVYLKLTDKHTDRLSIFYKIFLFPYYRDYLIKKYKILLGTVWKEQYQFNKNIYYPKICRFENSKQVFKLTKLEKLSDILSNSTLEDSVINQLIYMFSKDEFEYQIKRFFSAP